MIKLCWKIAAVLAGTVFWFGTLGPAAVSSESTAVALGWGLTTLFGLATLAGWLIQRFNMQQNKGESK